MRADFNDDFYLDFIKAVRLRASFVDEVSDEIIRDIIDEVFEEFLQEKYIDIQKRIKYKTKAFNALRRLDILQELIDDTSISEIMVNSVDEIFVEQDGKVRRLDYGFDSLERLEYVIQTIVAKVDRTVNESVPIVDARLENGSRVNVVLPPVALKGPTLSIRKFPDKALDFNDIIANETLPKDALDFLISLVKERYNIFISGGTSSGKTTFLNILSNAIPKAERIITIEDSAELSIKNIDNLVSLETRNVNVEGKGEISIRNLIKTSLRMRPDRIIVGEVRGVEVIDMLQAMNTGHDGSLSTGHANSAKDMLTRLETMVLMDVEMPIIAIRQMIDSGIDIIVHLAKISYSKRRVVEICELVGLENGEIVLNKIYDYDKALGKLVKVGDLMNKRSF